MINLERSLNLVLINLLLLRSSIPPLVPPSFGCITLKNIFPTCNLKCILPTLKLKSKR